MALLAQPFAHLDEGTRPAPLGGDVGADPPAAKRIPAPARDPGQRGIAAHQRVGQIETCTTTAHSQQTEQIRRAHRADRRRAGFLPPRGVHWEPKRGGQKRATTGTRPDSFARPRRSLRYCRIPPHDRGIVALPLRRPLGVTEVRSGMVERAGRAAPYGDHRSGSILHRRRSCSTMKSIADQRAADQSVCGSFRPLSCARERLGSRVRSRREPGLECGILKGVWVVVRRAAITPFVSFSPILSKEFCGTIARPIAGYSRCHVADRRGRGGADRCLAGRAARLVCRQPARSPLAADARSVPDPPGGDDAPTDPGAARVAALARLARTLPHTRSPRRRAERRCPARVVRPRLQQPRRAPPGGRADGRGGAWRGHAARRADPAGPARHRRVHRARGRLLRARAGSAGP